MQRLLISRNNYYILHSEGGILLGPSSSPKKLNLTSMCTSHDMKGLLTRRQAYCNTDWPAVMKKLMRAWWQVVEACIEAHQSGVLSHATKEEDFKKWIKGVGKATQSCPYRKYVCELLMTIPHPPSSSHGGNVASDSSHANYAVQIGHL